MTDCRPVFCKVTDICHASALLLEEHLKSVDAGSNISQVRFGSACHDGMCSNKSVLEDDAAHPQMTLSFAGSQPFYISLLGFLASNWKETNWINYIWIGFQFDSNRFDLTLSIHPVCRNFVETSIWMNTRSIY